MRVGLRKYGEFVWGGLPLVLEGLEATAGLSQDKWKRVMGFEQWTQGEFSFVEVTVDAEWEVLVDRA